MVGDVNFQQKCLRSIELFLCTVAALTSVSHDLSTIQSGLHPCDLALDGRIHADGDPLDVGMAYLESMAHREHEHTQVDAANGSIASLGTGRVRIHTAELCSADGQPREPFSQRRDPPHSSSLSHADGVVSAPIFGIAIHHRQNRTDVCLPQYRF